jgi:uncharacterized protein YndB with AHSA1/START domain
MNPQFHSSRSRTLCDAPRELVYRAFTDPDHLAAWWGPSGNSLPRDEIEFDVRPGGYQRWTEVNAAEPDLRVHIYIDLTNVTPGELLEGVMQATGHCRRASSHSRPDSGSNSTTSLTDGPGSKSASGSPKTWPPPASRAGLRRSPSWTPRWQAPRLLRPIIER